MCSWWARPHSVASVTKRWSEEGKRKDFRFRSMINQHTTIWRNTKWIEEHAQNVVGKYVAAAATATATAARFIGMGTLIRAVVMKSLHGTISFLHGFGASAYPLPANNMANSHERFTNFSAVCCILLSASSLVHGIALPVYSILKHESDINYHRHETKVNCHRNVSTSTSVARWCLFISWFFAFVLARNMVEVGKRERQKEIKL